MDSTPVTARTLVRPLDVMLRLGDSCGSPVRAELSYNARDPYAVTLAIRLHGRSVPWIFARSLLGRGLTTPTGDGDVHIWPDLDDEGHAVVTVELWSRQGQALVELRIPDVVEFISLAYTIVAAGEEFRHLELDAVIAAIRAAETG